MVDKLPAGRHKLSREQVSADQRRRIFDAMTVVMVEKGYANTTIADIVGRARVSRPTFYEYFDDKQDCFMTGYAHLQQRIFDGVLKVQGTGTPLERFDAMLGNYLSTIAANPATSRLYLVEVYAAGPDAMRRRLTMQQQFVDGVVTIFKARTQADRFACQSLVATTSTLVTHALAADDAGSVLALRKPIVKLAERLSLDKARATTA